MRFETWLPLFGLAATDAKVVAALADAGHTGAVKLPPQTSTTGIDFKPHGISLGFTSAFRLHDGDATLPILASLVLKPAARKDWKAYPGPLPHGLAPSDGKDAVVAKLGPAVALDDYFCSGGWDVDGLRLGILFTDDWSLIRQLGLSLPRAL